MLKIENKNVVVPGELLSEGMDYLPSHGTYREGNNIRAQKLGLANIEGKVIKIIPLSGRYIPKKGDTVVGKVIDVLMSGWRIELNSPYSAVISLKDGTSEFIPKGDDLTKYIGLDAFIVGKITNVTNQSLVDITLRGPGLKKLSGGRVIKVSPAKVPRIIGKGGSMIRLIKQATDCYIVVGQNGYVWLKGEPKEEVIAVDAIIKIDAEGHKSGLTDEIKKYLEKVTGRKLENSEVENTEGDTNDLQ